MSNGIEPTGQSPTLNLKFGDNTTMTMDFEFASELNSNLTRFDAEAADNPTFGRGEQYDRLARIIDTLDDAGINAARNNSVRFDTSATEYTEDLAYVFSKQNRIAEDTGNGDAVNVSSIARSFTNAYDEAVSGRPELNDASLSSTSAADDEPGIDMKNDKAPKGQTPSSEVVGDVRNLLDDAKATNNSSEKSDALSDAIQALIAAIRGDAPAEPASDRADELGEKLNQITESLGGDEDVAPKGKDTEKPARTDNGSDAKPAAQDAESTTYAGDDLMSMLEGTSKRMPDKPASLSLDARDQGIGVGVMNAQVGSGESLTFRAPERAESGSVELVDLFANDRNEAGGQDVAKLKVYDGQELVKEIEVRGDKDGKQTVDIDAEFDRIEMTSDGKDSDFALKSVTLNGTDASEPAEAPAKPAPVETSNGNDATDGFSFDKGQLLNLLEALGGTLGLIDGSKELSESDKDSMFDKIGDLLDSIVSALDAKGEGGAEITREELVDIVEGVEGLNTGIEGNVEDGAEKNTALDGLADALAQIFSAVEAGDTGSSSDDEGSEPEFALA